MSTVPLTNRIMLAVTIAFSAGVAAGGVGDLSYAAVATPGTAFGGAWIQMGRPGDPKAMGLTHPKALVAMNAAITVAFDSDDPKADTLDVARINMTDKFDFTKAVTVKLVKATVTKPNYILLRLPPRPFTMRKDGKDIRVLLSGSYHKYEKRETRIVADVRVRMTGQGECRFGDTVRKVRVVDGNCNLILGDVVSNSNSRWGGALTISASSFAGSDYCLIADAKGKFVPSPANRVLFGQTVKIDGAWYVLTVKDMKITAKSVPAGTLSVKARRWKCELSRDGHKLKIGGGAKPVRLPAGEYLLCYQAEWASVHEMRKVVVSCYSDTRTTLKRLEPESFGAQRFE